jgi:hypothetical protein
VSVPARDEMQRAEALADALRAAGVPCDVEPRAGLAIVTTTFADSARLTESAARREIIALAKAHGFTHVAVELDARSADAGAPVLRD